MPSHTPVRLAAALAFLPSAFLSAQEAGKKSDEPVQVLERFVLEETVDDPMGVLPTAPTPTVFGLSRTSLDTPRSLTSLSGEMLEQYGVVDIADLTRVAPSSYTTFNFGIQGGIDIRGVAGDSYFRGVKRVENRSSLPTPLGATDRVEIVRGPPSPIYGSGKIGGYMNYVPKTARAATGKYLDKIVGRATVTYGSYDKKIVTAEMGGSAKVGSLPAGYYVYAQFEDSGSYYNDASKQQQIVQATFNVDLSRSVRVEAGTMLQHWRGVGVVGWNRVTQALVDNGTYGTGVPLRNLDTDASGVIELNEITAAGGLIRTIPYAALTNPALLPVLGTQYALDPATVGTATIGTDQVILEPYVDAHDEIVFVDLIFDPGSTFTVTNKIYLEQLKQVKYQSLSFARRQDQFSFEDKLVIEQNPMELGSKFSLSNALAFNFRYSDNDLATSGNNQIYSRPDITRELTPNVQIANSVQHLDRYPWGSRTKTSYPEAGVGLLSSLDSTLIPVSVILGGRYDFIDAQSATPAGLAGNPAPTSANNADEGFSYSASVTLTPFKAIRPYVTVAEQSVLVVGNGGTLSVNAVRLGALDSAGLFESGIKGSFLGGKLFMAGAYYDQERKSFDSDTGETTATRGQGWEIEMKYAPHKRLSISLAGNWQKTVYDPIAGRNYTISPETAGYSPAVAQAGQIRVALPASVLYEERVGSPRRLFSLSSTYYFNDQWALSGSFTHQSDFYADAMKVIKLPEANVANLSLIWIHGRFNTRVSVYNLTNERYFRANQVDSAGGVTVLPNLPRLADVKVTYEF